MLAAIALATACGTLSHGNRKTVKVKGNITIERPACGASAEKGTGAMPDSRYFLKEGATNDPAVIATNQFVTDENGNFSINLKAGTYVILHPDKLMNYAEFKLKHSSQSTYFKNRDEDCFKRWYASPDFILTVSNDTTVAFLVKSRCYTETNPCLEYTGPK